MVAVDAGQASRMQVMAAAAVADLVFPKLAKVAGDADLVRRVSRMVASRTSPVQAAMAQASHAGLTFQAAVTAASICRSFLTVASQAFRAVMAGAEASRVSHAAKKLMQQSMRALMQQSMPAATLPDRHARRSSCWRSARGAGARYRTH